jgi:hypothetical protein
MAALFYFGELDKLFTLPDSSVKSLLLLPSQQFPAPDFNLMAVKKSYSLPGGEP